MFNNPARVVFVKTGFYSFYWTERAHHSLNRRPGGAGGVGGASAGAGEKESEGGIGGGHGRAWQRSTCRGPAVI